MSRRGAHLRQDLPRDNDNLEGLQPPLPIYKEMPTGDVRFHVDLAEQHVVEKESEQYHHDQGHDGRHRQRDCPLRTPVTDEPQAHREVLTADGAICEYV